MHGTGTYEKICLIVSDTLDKIDTPLTTNTTLEELGADSLDAVFISASIEEEFNININHEEFNQQFKSETTLGALNQFVKNKVAMKGRLISEF